MENTKLHQPYPQEKIRHLTFHSQKGIFENSDGFIVGKKPKQAQITQ